MRVSDGDKKSDMFSCFDTIPAHDGRTSCVSIVRTVHTHRTVKLTSPLIHHRDEILTGSPSAGALNAHAVG